jgi:hypothetical protein
MKNLFVFDFVLEEEEVDEHYPVLTYGLELFGSEEEIDAIVYEQEFQDEVETIEMKYGIHDWGSGYEGDYNQSIGYNSYEISREHIQNVLKEWLSALDQLNIKHATDWEFLEESVGG